MMLTFPRQLLNGWNIVYMRFCIITRNQFNINDGHINTTLLKCFGRPWDHVTEINIDFLLSHICLYLLWIFPAPLYFFNLPKRLLKDSSPSLHCKWDVLLPLIVFKTHAQYGGKKEGWYQCLLLQDAAQESSIYSLKKYFFIFFFWSSILDKV